MAVLFFKHVQKSILLPLLLALLLFNPVIVFLLTGSIGRCIGSVAGFTFLLIYTYLKGADWAFTLLVNVLTVGSICFHLEVAFRHGFPEYVIENLYTIRGDYYFNKPHLLSHLEDKEYSVTYKTNQQGYRIPEFAAANENVTHCDWLFLGDSFTQGAQVPFEELYTSQLYRYFPNKVIVNAGISGFSVADEYHYYRAEGRKLKPKKVFLQICNFNDFMNVTPRRNSWTEYLMQYSDLARYLLFNIRYKPPGELPLGRWTEPFYPTKKDNATYNIFYNETSSAKEADLKAFTHYVSALAQEVKAGGAELVIILIPTKEQTYYRYLDEVITSFKIPAEKLDLLRPNKIVGHLADSLHVQLVDLLPGFQDIVQSQFFEYDEHLNPHGHRTTADIISRHLKDEFSDVNLISKELFSDRYPAYSPDGQLFTYQSVRDGTMELFLQEIKSDQSHRLTFNKVDESHPMLSPNQSLLVFTEGDPAENQTKVTIMNSNGSNRRYITNDKNEYGAIAAFSPGGRYLTYAGWFYDVKTGQYSNPQIILLDMELGTKKAVTRDLFESWRPVMAPKEDFVIYISKRNGNFDLYKLDLKTAKEEQLTRTSYDEWDPVISPDGSYILYAARKNGNWDLFELSLSSGQSRQLTRTLGDEWDPVYHPKKSAIAYAGKFGMFQSIYRKPLGR